MAVHFDVGERVTEDVRSLQTDIASCPDALSSAERQVRAVFGDDPTRAFTNHIFWTMDFLRSISGAELYDERRKEFLGV